MRTVLLRCLAAALAFTLLAPMTWAADPLPRLKASGNQLVDPDGNPVILRGVSIPYLSQKRTKTVNERIDMAADAGADVIRLPLYAAHRGMDPLGSDERFIRPAVEHATSRGLYVIIDFHPIADLAKMVPLTHYFWHEIAPLYAEQDNVIYELYNEDSYFPGKKARPWSEFKSLIQPVVDIAREKAPDTLLLVSAPRWSSQLEGILEDPIADENVAYVWHQYPGQKREFWPQADELHKKHPIFVTEFGWQNKGKKTYTISGSTEGWGESFLGFIERRGMSWTAFCWDNEHGPVMFDEEWNLLGGNDYCGERIVEVMKNDGLAQQANRD